MKKKILILFIALLPSLIAMAQNNVETAEPEKEEETSVTSLQDIINTQQDLNARGYFSSHTEDVWQRGGYFNFIYQSPATMAFLETATTAESSMKGRDIKAAFGFAIQSGKNHRLHKKPIANILGFNLDYTPLDLFANCYKDNALAVNASTGESDQPRPWGNTFWEINYSMALGPSITIAPFVPIKKDGLDYFKLNVYYHVGYCASIILLNDSDQKSDRISVDFGYGLYTSFGLNFSWKTIGFGYEYRKGDYDFLPLSGTYEGNYKIASKQNRVYINLRF